MFGSVYFGEIGFGMELALLQGIPGLVVGGDRVMFKVSGGDSGVDGGLIHGGVRSGGLVVGGDAAGDGGLVVGGDRSGGLVVGGDQGG